VPWDFTHGLILKHQCARQSTNPPATSDKQIKLYTRVCKIDNVGNSGVQRASHNAPMEGTHEYNLAIRHFHDALNGLDSALEEARLRCEQARRICQEARTVYERTKTQPLPARSLAPCAERDRLEEQCGRAVIAYGDAVENIQISRRVTDGREELERARSTCNSVFEALEDHEREHNCTRAKSTRGSAKGKSA